MGGEQKGKEMDDNNPRMTGRLRTDVRILDVLADDLSNGTELEQAVGVLLGRVAAVIVNDEVATALMDIERIATLRPRADHLEAARMAAQVAEDAR